MKKENIFWLIIIVFFIFLFSQKFNNENPIDKALKKRVRMKNQDYLNLLNPAVRDKFTAFVRDIESVGYTVVITSSYRSVQEQDRLKRLDARNASPGFSSHNYGTALDLVLVKKGKVIADKSSPRSVWEATAIPKLAKNQYGMRWGGDFAGYNDPVHFDYNNLYDTKKLYAEAIKQFGSLNKIVGNELNLL